MDRQLQLARQSYAGGVTPKAVYSLNVICYVRFGGGAPVEGAEVRFVSDVTDVLFTNSTGIVSATFIRDTLIGMYVEGEVTVIYAPSGYTKTKTVRGLHGQTVTVVFDDVIPAPTYSPSSATTPISVMEEVVGTSLTIVAPERVRISEVFTVAGRLVKVDTSEGIPDMAINVYYNSQGIGSIATDGNGDYSIDVAIPVAGEFVLKAEFPGTSGLGSSSAETRILAGELPPVRLRDVLILGLVVIGAVFGGYYVLRR